MIDDNDNNRNHEGSTFVAGIRIRLSHRKDETLPILESSKLEAKSLKGVFVSRSKAVLPPFSLFPETKHPRAKMAVLSRAGFGKRNRGGEREPESEERREESVREERGRWVFV